jgi:drug/metabolite transporter (DMT)-like permease
MRAADAARLVALAAIWGASFLFTRIVAPALGPIATADLRMLLGGAALAAYFWLVGYDPQWRRWIRQYTVVGMLTSGLPFLLFAYAALDLTAGLLSVLNATSPMWGALLSFFFLKEGLSPARIAGLVLGVAGVALVSRPAGAIAPLAVAAALAAPFLYGLTGVYLKRRAAEAPARGMAVGTQVAAGLVILPFIAVSPPAAAPTPLVAASVLALGLLCSAVAYVLYFRLIADIGATGALTVTYLIPVFGVLWGAVFLGETVSLSMLGGAALVVLGTVLVLRN